MPDFNSRLGSNRLAAEAAAALGRKLYAGGQYWEVYVRTQPASLPVTYDPGNPAVASGAASRVTSAEVVIATESAAAIKVFSLGGPDHERSVLGELDAVLRARFPALGGETIRIYYGETFQHGLATFDHGRLAAYDVRRSS